MRISPPDFNPGPSVHQLVAYIANLELEVDRLRKQDQYLRHAFDHEIENIRSVLKSVSLPNKPAATLQQTINELAAVIDDVVDPPDDHPAQDQVAAIEVRPLVERVFAGNNGCAKRPMPSCIWNCRPNRSTGFQSDFATFWTICCRTRCGIEIWIRASLGLPYY